MPAGPGVETRFAEVPDELGQQRAGRDRGGLAGASPDLRVNASRDPDLRVVREAIP